MQRYRKRVPLPQLQKSLRTHHASARQELVELINEILGVGMWERGRPGGSGWRMVWRILDVLIFQCP